ncbi:ScpA family protein [Bartonella sp. HY038]|uniref:segregation and condensation protein A n=1 Tax=Bartonella sp. HY038 TaxID=2759660 RepID=UPI0015F8FAD7|nr:ScpA family protein [Bartonella sp. HY038]
MSEWWDDETRGVSEPALVVDVQGFEGPMDLLLHLSRTQKVDLTRISIVALVDQYLQFIKQAQQVRLELAADYLVMAAWLAYLKSRLLVPKKQGEQEASGEEMAEMLQFRLRRLEAMRDAAGKLINRNRLGRDVFKRGAPEMVVVERKNRFNTTLYELLTAYTGIRQRQAVSHVEVGNRKVWPLKYARQILSRMVGDLSHDWLALDQYLLRFISDDKERKTAIASAFAASLEMVREGQVELRQSGAFLPLYMRVKQDDRDEDREQLSNG